MDFEFASPFAFIAFPKKKGGEEQKRNRIRLRRERGRERSDEWQSKPTEASWVGRRKTSSRVRQ